MTDRALYRAALLVFGVLVLFVVFCSMGCPPAPVCTVGATRCAPVHEVAEVCDSRGQWRMVADCGEVELHSGGEWECGQAIESGVEVSACLPVGRGER